MRGGRHPDPELFQTSEVCSGHVSNKTQSGRDESLMAVRSQLKKKKHLGASLPAPHKSRDGETLSQGGGEARNRRPTHALEGWAGFFSLFIRKKQRVADW